MPRVLALSSHVAYGSVGLAAIVPALQALGHEVVALPTVVLSNHPGHPSFSGEQIAPATLAQILDALDANGWLPDIDAVLTGYLPTAAHVDVARAACERVRWANASALLVCDPVLGDAPGGLYIDEAAASAIQRNLMPICDLATPNAFELAWMSRVPVETTDDAVAAARALAMPRVVVTSVPASDERLATLLVGAEMAPQACFVPRRPTAPHGTGDLLAALYLGHVLNDEAPGASLARAVAAVEASIARSASRDELSLAAASAMWTEAAGVPTVTL